MKQDWSKILIFGILFLIGGMLLGIIEGQKLFTPTRTLGALGDNNIFFSVSTSSQVTVGSIASTNASSTLVLPSSTGRTWAIISANTGSLYCNYAGFVGTSTVPVQLPSFGNGFIIATNTVWTIDQTNGIFTGPVICTAYSTTTAHIEANQ